MLLASQSSVARVRAYYEQNTRFFLVWSRNRSRSTIHRAVWAPGVTTEEQAVHAIHNLIETTISQSLVRAAGEQLRIVDLGCGVGGTLLYLTRRLPHFPEAVGITISSLQARLAQASFREAQHAHCHSIEADFLNLPCSPAFDYAIAIESFVHAPDSARAFAQAAAALKPGGCLLICDDFLSDDGSSTLLHPSQQAWIDAFRDGWRAAGLISRSTAVELARQAHLHLVEAQDSTPYLRLVHFPDWLGRTSIRASQFLPKGWALFQSFIGSLALQYCLRYGLTQYHWLVFQKQGDDL